MTSKLNIGITNKLFLAGINISVNENDKFAKMSTLNKSYLKVHLMDLILWVENFCLKGAQCSNEQGNEIAH